MSDMDDKNPIKYVLIGDSSTMKIITEYSSGNVEAKTKKEINRIFNKLAKLPNKKYDERNKITSKEENYYFINIKPNLLFIILANNQYPERYVFELISKIIEDNIPTMINDETRELNPTGRQALKELVNKYQDIKNINKMVESVENVNDLQNKSEQLKLESEDYKKTSVEIRKVTWWQNCKLWAIIAGIVILIVLIIVLVTVL